MSGDIMKKIMYLIIIIISIFLLVIIDYLNVITKLGLSISFWSGMVVGIFPIFLTIFLWKKEEKDRIHQIKEETNFQKKLIARSQYMDYYEKLLEQIRNYKIFIKAHIMDTDKVSTSEKAKSLVKTCYLYSDDKIWNLNYRIFPFKAIDIDIFKYQYRDKEINLRAYLPYIEVLNRLNAITKGEELAFTLGGGYLKKLTEKDKIEKAKELIDSKEAIKELYNFLDYLSEDIENRII